ADFNQAIAASPNNALMLTNQGVVYERKGQLDLALNDYDRAITIDPSYQRAASLKQVILGMRARQAQGAPTASTTAPPLGSPGQAALTQAYMLFGQRKIDEAIAATDRALTLDPKLVSALNFRAALRVIKRQLTEAIADLDQVLALVPGDKAARTMRGRIFADL